MYRCTEDIGFLKRYKRTCRCFFGWVGMICIEFVVGLRDKMEVSGCDPALSSLWGAVQFFEYLDNYMERLPVIELVLVGLTRLEPSIECTLN